MTTSLLKTGLKNSHFLFCGYIVRGLPPEPLPFFQLRAYRNENSAGREEVRGKQIPLQWMPELDSFLLRKAREALGGVPSISSTEAVLFSL